MVFDHIAVIFMEVDASVYTVFRIIGRLAFVLFAFLLAEGFNHTSNLKKYFLRLLGLAIIIEVVLLGYYLMGQDNYLLSFNIIWTLLLGLFSLYLIKQKNLYLRILVIPIIFIAEILSLSYGAYGVLMILFFGMYDNKYLSLLYLLMLNLIFIEYPLYSLSNLDSVAKFVTIQWYSVFAMIFIFLYNGKAGKYKLKYFFYAFYPLHLLLLYFISFLIQR